MPLAAALPLPARCRSSSTSLDQSSTGKLQGAERRAQFTSTGTFEDEAEIAVRELVANALIHEGFTESGTSVMIELHDDGMESQHSEPEQCLGFRPFDRDPSVRGRTTRCRKKDTALADRHRAKARGMNGLRVGCVAALVVACGGRTSQEIVAPAPVDASAPDDGDASVADAASDAAVSPEAGTCLSSTASGALSGNIADVPTRLNVLGDSVGVGLPVVQGSWSDLLARSPDEALLAWGTGGPDGGLQRDAGALIVAPTSGASMFYCAASVDANSSPANVGHAISIKLTDLSRLGECPGTSVSGEVDVCLGGSGVGPGPDCTQNFGVTGTVDGSEVRFRNLGGTISFASVAGDFHASVVGDGGDGGVILFANARDGKLKGWLRLPDNAASNAGSVFCLSSAFVLAQNNGAYSVAFQSIGRLGACPGTPIGGELGYCDRFQ